jgi:hypothetical protein
MDSFGTRLFLSIVQVSSVLTSKDNENIEVEEEEEEDGQEGKK